MQAWLLRRSTILILLALSLLSLPDIGAGAEPDQPDPAEKAVVDAVLETVLGKGLTVTLPTADDVMRQVEILGERSLVPVGVTLQATDPVREALENATRQLGGRSLDAHFEAEFGIAAWEARAFRVSPDPRTLKYLQTRIDALAFVLRLGLKNGAAFDCVTRNVWRIPVMPVRQLFAYGGRASIQGLGVSPVFEGKDYGYVAIRKTPVSFIFRATVPTGAFENLTQLDGRIVEAPGAGEESECQPAR